MCIRDRYYTGKPGVQLIRSITWTEGGMAYSLFFLEPVKAVDAEFYKEHVVPVKNKMCIRDREILMARKTHRPDDILWTVTAADIDAARSEKQDVTLGAVLDTRYPRKSLVKLFEEKLIHINGHKVTPKDVISEGEMCIRDRNLIGKICRLYMRGVPQEVEIEMVFIIHFVKITM